MIPAFSGGFGNLFKLIMVFARVGLRRGALPTADQGFGRVAQGGFSVKDRAVLVQDRHPVQAAAGEGLIPDARNAAWKGKIGQAGAGRKRIAVQGRQMSREGHLHQSAAALKGREADLRHTVGDRGVCHLAAVIKGVFSDVGRAVFDGHRGDRWLIALPRGVIHPVPHFAGTGDGQLS